MLTLARGMCLSPSFQPVIGHYYIQIPSFHFRSTYPSPFRRLNLFLSADYPLFLPQDDPFVVYRLNLLHATSLTLFILPSRLSLCHLSNPLYTTSCPFSNDRLTSPPNPSDFIPKHNAFYSSFSHFSRTLH